MLDHIESECKDLIKLKHTHTHTHWQERVRFNVINFISSYVDVFVCGDC